MTKRLTILLCLLLIPTGAGTIDLTGIAVTGVGLETSAGDAGPVTYATGNTQHEWGTDTTQEVTVSVQAGDLIVVAGSTYSSLAPTGIADSDTNSYTTMDLLASGSSGARLRSFYCLSAKSTLSLTITVTFGAGTGKIQVRRRDLR